MVKGHQQIKIWFGQIEYSINVFHIPHYFTTAHPLGPIHARTIGTGRDRVSVTSMDLVY
jgi:hypothetical protein